MRDITDILTWMILTWNKLIDICTGTSLVDRCLRALAIWSNCIPCTFFHSLIVTWFFMVFCLWNVRLLSVQKRKVHSCLLFFFYFEKYSTRPIVVLLFFTIWFVVVCFWPFLIVFFVNENRKMRDLNSVVEWYQLETLNW